MNRKIIFTCMLLLCCATGAYASGIEIAIGGWQQSISGPLSFQAVSDADVIELDEDIDFDEETKIFGRLKLDLPSVLPNIYVVAAPMDFEGTGTKTVAVNFGDKIFQADAELDAQITLNQYDFAIYYGLPFVKTATGGILNIDLGINARLVDFETTLKGREEGTGLTIEEGESLTVAVPMAYVAVQIMPTDSLAIEAEGRGIAVGDNKLLSIIGRIKYQFAGPAFGAAGYRLDNLEIDESDVVVDTEFKGPFIEFGISF